MKYSTGALIAMCLATGTFAAPTGEKPAGNVKIIADDSRAGGIGKTLSGMTGAVSGQKYADLDAKKLPTHRVKHFDQRDMELDAKKIHAGKHLRNTLRQRDMDSDAMQPVGDLAKALKSTRRSVEYDAKKVRGHKGSPHIRRSMELKKKPVVDLADKVVGLPPSARWSLTPRVLLRMLVPKSATPSMETSPDVEADKSAETESTEHNVEKESTDESETESTDESEIESTDESEIESTDESKSV
ncbi:hypothetical protein OCS_03532 [Ophiocordyceps sinensis CO18]|uniref:Uncharacterized protein n=1 Tax=Ophiocordyceps sinensis (strain Co18 / CGMCC 3.14243) TaxID=911162 RepID=T5AG91_OPHSC|nr:hypothetical protein OCS_03532 [Ophiocordyceps sinensis CO18]